MPNGKAFFLCLVGVLLILPAEGFGVPSFKRQTGMSCNACHTVFPELTPFGRSFKLGGYTLTLTQESFPPVAAMMQASHTHQKGLENRVDPFDDSPAAKTNLPQQASLFYGGKIFNHLGALAQLTYDGVSNNVFLDNTDIRYASNTKLFGRTLVYGLTLNNNPTVQDVWNTTPAWGFPYASSAVAVTPAAGAVIDGLLAQQVGGLGAYGFWNNHIYAEAALYRTNQKGVTRPLGAGTTTSTVVNGTVPYWRLAVQQQWTQSSLSVGTYGLVADIYPEGTSSGPADRFTDIAFDMQYQHIAKKHIITGQGTWIHETQRWNASFPVGNTDNRSDFLNTFRANVNYHYKNGFGTIGGSLGYFNTTGKRDGTLYSSGDVTGSRTGRPDTNGMIFEADYQPWDQWKISVQYIAYNKFNGSRSNYDGSGRNASDNNTAYFVVWIVF